MENFLQNIQNNFIYNILIKLLLIKLSKSLILIIENRWQYNNLLEHF
jgi:hypothetical protein